MATRHLGLDPAERGDDYENVVKQAGGVIRYTIDALAADGDLRRLPGSARCPAALRQAQG